MKKTLLTIIALFVMLTCVACAETGETTTHTDAQTTVQTTVQTIADTTAQTAADTTAQTTADTTAQTTAITTAESTEVTTLKQLIDNHAIENADDVKELRSLVWSEYAESIPASRKNDLIKGKITTITVNYKKMRVDTRVIGNKPTNGYPLFIVLHGGGQDPTGETNDSQWSGMADRYTAGKKAGIYVACRAIEDTWNCHSVDNAYMFYDRIIEDAILFMDADPNKVYIVGYSAGGDGVYQIAPRLADRFGACNMTAGHPNGISMINMYNLPMFLQVGELDASYSRNTETVKYGNLLTSLSGKYGGGYIHSVFVHSGKEHGVVGDNAVLKQPVVDDLDAWLEANGKAGSGGTTKAETNAAVLMTALERNPLPEKVIWDLATRGPSNRKINSFYWLSAPSTCKKGTIIASYDKAANKITISECTVKDKIITVYLNEEMLDIFAPVTLDILGDVTTVTPEISVDLLRTTTEERGDPNYQFAAKITFSISS